MSQHLEGLPIWMLYERPSDYPDQFVARLWMLANGGYEHTAETITDPDLEVVRSRVRDWLNSRGIGPVRLPRYAQDDPVILEDWL